MERERSQLVISLGEGAEGQRLRDALDRAAERAGKPVTVWARERLLAAAGDPKSEGTVDPICEVQFGREVALVDLRMVAGMQNGWTNKVRALIAHEWLDINTNKPDELIDRWKRVARWGRF